MPTEKGSGKKKKLLTDQTEEERLEIRKSIRVLHKDAADRRDELENVNNLQLVHTLEKAEKIHEKSKFSSSLNRPALNTNVLRALLRCSTLSPIFSTLKIVAHPTEAIVDLQAQLTLSDIAESGIRARNQAVDISIADLLHELDKRFCPDGDDFDWERVGMKAAEFISAVPPTRLLGGVLTKEFVRPKQRRHAKKKRKIVQEAKRTTKEIVDADKEEKAHTEGRVTSLKKKLKRAAKHGNDLINYFEVVCNPESFSQTVENVFDLSFIVKIGEAKIVMQNGVPHVGFHSYRKEENFEDLVSHQGIFKMNASIWKEMCTALNIEKPFIKTRTESA
eukprot:jgi/Bigna1/90621/estExt_fgenesh1_pg.C_750020